MQQPHIPQFDAELRSEQIAAGRTMIDEDEPAVRRTLSVARPGMRVAAPEVAGRARPRTNAAARPGTPLKGHEAFIKALEFSGATAQIEKISSGEKVIGTLKHSDKFTITIRAKDGGVERDRVIFKHDISEFCALTPRADAPVEGRTE